MNNSPTASEKLKVKVLVVETFIKITGSSNILNTATFWYVMKKVKLAVIIVQVGY